MKPEIKQLWLEALRSGNYKQGRGRLCIVYPHETLYCCLGVLEDLHDKTDPTKISVLRNYMYLSGETIKWAGLDNRNPYVGQKKLSYMNDSSEMNFNQIADEIEKHL
jgi:hypothetical protein